MPVSRRRPCGSKFAAADSWGRGYMAVATLTSSVLVVDDEEKVLRAVARNLRLASIPVVTALCGEHALLILARQPIAVIISDSLTLPITGLELFRKARKNHPEIVTILLSGLSTPAEVQLARMEGILHAFVAKPWDNDHLLHLIRSLSSI